MNLIQHFLIWVVRLYRWTVSPAKTFLFGPLSHCRFTPSCSQYALDALQTHGAGPGGWLALKRLCRCHPWGGCGHDPVSEKVPGARCQVSGARCDVSRSTHHVHPPQYRCARPPKQFCGGWRGRASRIA